MSRDAFYLATHRDEPMHEFQLAAWQGFRWDRYLLRHVEYSTQSPEDLNLDAIRLDAAKPVVGTVEFIQQLFAYWGRTLPKPLNVPEELLPFAGRPITRLSLEQALLALEKDERPTFIKPADSAKLFTGDVVQTPAHVALLFADLDPQTPVLISPEINLVTEYRVFVNRDREIVSVRHYLGDPFVRPSKLTIRMMIDKYTQAPCAYALDVAVTSTGKTVVVECNDFWALGTYGMDPLAYSRLLAQRWHQLLT